MAANLLTESWPRHARTMAVTPNRSGPAAGCATQFAAGVGEFAEKYDTWLLDQWGVLHDGHQPFPGVIACLRRLVGLGKDIVVLSNSGKSVAANTARLASLGISPHLYRAVVTSGEMARALLAKREPPFEEALGQRCLLLSSDRDRSITDGLPITRVATVGDADFILLSGVDDSLPRSYYQATFELGCARGLPLICANPDLMRFTDEGVAPSAGEFARLYEDLGGRVQYIGKPHRAIYRFALAQCRSADPARTIAIGDSLYHDIGGGGRAGLATAFVTDGIHRHEFAAAHDTTERLALLRELVQDYGAEPDWAIREFRW